MIDDEAHVLRDARSFQAIGQRLAHGLDARAHFAQLFFPQGAPFGGVQHGGNHGGAMRGRVAVVGADGELELAEHAGGFILALAHHGEGAHALAVETEALAERSGDEKAQASGRKFADDGAVFRQALTKALVGHIEERS